MAAKLTRLTHKIAIQLHLVAESCTFAVLAPPGGQSGNFWIHPGICKKSQDNTETSEFRNGFTKQPSWREQNKIL
jgi:hypothetical protein